MELRRVLLAVSLVSVTGNLAFASSPAVSTQLNPSGPWEVHYESDSCKLRRDFKGAGDQVGIEFARFEPGDQFQFVIIGKPLEPLMLSQSYVVQFGNQPAQQVLYPTLVKGENGIPAAFSDLPGIKPIPMRDWILLRRHKMPPPQVVMPDEEESVGSILVANPAYHFVLRTGPLGSAMAALRDCMDKVVTSWGVDPKRLKTNAQPKGSPSDWLFPKDYPRDALHEHKSGLLQFRLSIDPNGAVTNCNILRAINESAFVQTTCRLLRERAHFKPARDVSGIAVPGYFVSSVRFVTPPK